MEATYPLEKLFLFSRYQTRDAYKALVGIPPPEFNPMKRPKFWADPSAITAPLRNVCYERTIALTDRGLPAVGPDGKPMLEMLMLPKLEAGSVNIPPEGTNIDGAEMPEWPMPLKSLPTGHELTFHSGSVPGGGVVSVIDTVAAALQVEGFTAADRALLRAIAMKLGV